MNLTNWLKERIRIAEGATPGPWFENLYQAGAYRVEAKTNPEITPVVWRPANAKHIASCSPDVMLAIYEVLGAAMEYGKFASLTCSQYHDMVDAFQKLEALIGGSDESQD